MGENRYYHYFVEGENEEKIVRILKTDMRLIAPGKVEIFNVVERKLTKLRLMSLKKNTTVVLVFDTDTNQTATLWENIDFLNKDSSVKEVLCITQVQNLEDELKRSCNITHIKELTGSRTDSEFKHDMLKDSQFAKKLKIHKFDFEKFWNTAAKNNFSGIQNDAEKIKIVKNRWKH